MATRNAATSRLIAARRSGGGAAWRDSPLAPFACEGSLLEIGAIDVAVEAESQQTVIAAYRLQDLGDYRAALQNWFRAVAIGGHLLIVVPHAFLYERRLELPSRWNPGQRRLYTPASLIGEIEEALPPNSYRLRYLSDADQGYNYDLPIDREPEGASDVLLAIEKIEAPAWSLSTPVIVKAGAPDYAFEPMRTRIEVAIHPAHRRILILKLDHVGDFIMAIPALERARAVFADSEITLVVGPWNVQTARELGLADHVIAFDAFPRNSSEQEVDVHAKVGLFQQLVTEDYDLAIDLRTDVDTRVLLRQVKAGVRAGIGTAARFPFLDIFLPVDFNRNQPEAAREYRYNMHDFHSQGPVTRSDHRMSSRAAQAERDCAIVWGPYERVRAGRYFFEPFMELEPATEGLLLLDIGIDTRRVAYHTIAATESIRLPFVVEEDEALFEFRIWTVEDLPAIDFNFYGGRLVREGAGSTLHHSEYTLLLIELIAMRLARTGVLADARSV